ncbi:hypothetical protein CHELA20_53193 [Hyphomicrobiales bacterium]|nr:hypothetical protein CHELA41_21730 [Hyphomicrobiales bacterium]CAH1683760.1 hypothetical protein CHELA20_53193 [Hyphomicrobiales bacterium]
MLARTTNLTLAFERRWAVLFQSSPKFLEGFAVVLRIATRPSKLALWQARYVKSLINGKRCSQATALISEAAI